MRTITKATALAAATVIMTAGAANAAVLVDATGVGFVGKGDVQTALVMNNAALQNAVKNNTLIFTASRPAAQSFSQAVTQSATQLVTEEFTRTVSCTTTQGRTTQTNHGTREGLRTGEREGTRQGARTGSLNGTIAYSVVYDARLKNQFTGFNLTSVTSSGFTADSAEPIYGEPDFPGDFEWTGGDLGKIEWGGWDAEPGDNPASCLSNPNATDVVDSGEVSSGVYEGDVVEGDVVGGAVTEGQVAPTGNAKVFVQSGSTGTPVALN